MRLDKYLKVSRLIKRRVIAKEVSNTQRIQVNHKPSKASTDVKVNDILTITLGKREIEVQITSITPSIHKEDANGMYKILSEKVIEREENNNETF